MKLIKTYLDKIPAKLLNTGVPFIDLTDNKIETGNFIAIGARPNNRIDDLLSFICNNISINDEVLYASFNKSENEIEMMLKKYEHDNTRLYYLHCEYRNIIEFVSDLVSNIISYNLKTIIIDGYEFFQANYKSQSKGQLNSQIKKIAKQYNCTIIFTVPLSRDPEIFGGEKFPQIHHIEYFIGIEYLVDKIILCYSYEQYGFTEDINGKSTKNRIDLEIHNYKNQTITRSHFKLKKK